MQLKVLAVASVLHDKMAEIRWLPLESNPDVIFIVFFYLLALFYLLRQLQLNLTEII